MDLIWDIIIVFGLVSLLILVVGIWTQLDMRKQQRQEEESVADAKPRKGRMSKKRLMMAAAAAVLGATAIIAFRPSAKPVFLETTTARYRVLSARYMVGTNLAFAQDEPVAAWYRRTRKAVRSPIRGFPGDWTFRDGLKRHAIAVLCDGQFPTNQMSQIAREMEAECIDDTGRTIRFRGMTSIARNDERFWFVWSYAASELTNLHQRGYADFQVTNFCPTRLRLLRKSDHHELTRLDLSR